MIEHGLCREQFKKCDDWAEEAIDEDEKERRRREWSDELNDCLAEDIAYSAPKP